jgi:hypothetical protein
MIDPVLDLYCGRPVLLLRFVDLVWIAQRMAPLFGAHLVHKQALRPLRGSLKHLLVDCHSGVRVGAHYGVWFLLQLV